jgi:hypothetical protein
MWIRRKSEKTKKGYTNDAQAPETAVHKQKSLQVIEVEKEISLSTEMCHLYLITIQEH